MAKVLLIDDDTCLLDNTAELLKLANYEVACAHNGKQGLELAVKGNPDLILCDVAMPELDGFGVLRAIENIVQLKGTSFVFVSARTEEEDLRHGMELGADDYLFKPYSGEKLLSTVATRVKKAMELKEAFKASLNLSIPVSSGHTSLNAVPGLMEKFTLKTLRKKETIFLEGEESRYIFYVSKGKVKTYKSNEAGKDYISSILTTGDFFGFNTFSDSCLHQESAEAIENVEIGYLAKGMFMQAMEMNPELSSKFIRFLSTALCETRDTLVKLAYNSARKRVAEALLYIARKYDNELTAPFPLIRNDISAVSGISPESVSRNMTDFRSENLIEVDEGYIRITNPGKLAAVKN